MAVCCEDNNKRMTTRNEHDALRYSRKYREVKTTVETMDPQTWWKRNMIDVIEPLKAVLEEKKVEKDQKLAILASVLVNTNSSSQLGTMHNMLAVTETKKCTNQPNCAQSLKRKSRS